MPHTTQSAAKEQSQQTSTGTPGAAVAPRTTTSAPRAARTAAAPPVPPPDFTSTTLVPSTTRFEDLPCISQGSLGAGNVCEASRVWTTDGAACDGDPQAALVYRLTPLVTTLPRVPGMLGFLEVLRQAEATRNATFSYAPAELEVAFRVASAWRSTSRNPSIPGTGGSVVTRGVSRYMSSAWAPPSQAAPSASVESYLTFVSEEQKQVGVPMKQAAPMPSHALSSVAAEHAGVRTARGIVVPAYRNHSRHMLCIRWRLTP